MTLIQGSGRPLGKFQISKYLTAVCPKFESFIEDNGFHRTLLLSPNKVNLKKAFYKIPFERKCFRQVDGNLPEHNYATKRSKPTAAQLDEDPSTCLNIDDLQDIIKQFKGKYTYEEGRVVPHGAPSYNFPSYISIDTNQDNIKIFGDNDALFDIPTCSSTSRQFTLNLEA